MIRKPIKKTNLYPTLGQIKNRAKPGRGARNLVNPPHPINQTEPRRQGTVKSELIARKE
jgi:hypothetical protein